MKKRKLFINKVYTRSGDTGTTGLVGGERISKGSLKLESYGTVDELNTLVGVVRTYALDYKTKKPKVYKETSETFHIIQNRLFDLGSILATPADKPYKGMPSITLSDVTFLEEKIDEWNAMLKPLESFTLPGGGKLNAHAHVARTVCRRLERILNRLSKEENIHPTIHSYINRLSDLLYVYTRWVSLILKDKVFLWERPGLKKAKTKK